MPRLLPALLAALTATIGCAASSSGPSAPPFDVSIVNGASLLTTTAFSPDSFTISLASKDTVSWRNADVGTSGGYYGGGTAGVSHHIVSDSAGVFDAGVMSPGGYFAHRFTAPGKFHYHCSIHPGMVGVIVVTS
ncbi:MAG: plastocyanin/azurin family copper-binding protein [Gemmatimonadales bacterium]